MLFLTIVASKLIFGACLGLDVDALHVNLVEQFANVLFRDFNAPREVLHIVRMNRLLPCPPGGKNWFAKWSKQF